MEKFKVSFEANNQQLKALGTKHASDTYADIEATFVLGEKWTDMDSVSAVWWNDFTRVATVLDSQGKCVVPHEVLTRKGCVRVNLVGSIVEGDELITRLTSYSAEAVQVNEKIKLTGNETSEITPSQYEQFVANVKADADRAEAGATASANSADEAEASAQNASESASASAVSASDSARSATASAQSAQNASESAQSAENAKDDAEDARDEILGMRATAETLEAGSDATASYSDGLLTLGIPRGDQGEQGIQGETGATPNLTIGTVETLEPTEDATASITGTAENPVLNLGLPKGDTGEVSQAEFDEAVSDLKSDLSPISNYSEMDMSEEFSDGSYWGYNPIVSYEDNTMSNAKIAFRSGDKFLITAKGVPSVNVAFYQYSDNTKGKVIDNSGTDGVDAPFNPTDSGYLYINTLKSYKDFASIKKVSTKWTTDRIDALNDDINALYGFPNANAISWVLARVSAYDGTVTSSTNRYKTKEPLPIWVTSVTALEGYSFGLFAYDNGTYKGWWNGAEWSKVDLVWKTSINFTDAVIKDGYDLFVVFRKNDNANLSATDIPNIKFNVPIFDNYLVDTNLQKRLINVDYLGALTYHQSFLKYDNKYYSTDGDNIAVQDSDFEAISSTAISVGHGNGFCLGFDKYGYVSGWDDNTVYKIDLDNLSLVDTIALPTTGYTTCAVDDINGIIYIFQRDTYPSTRECYNLIVYDYINDSVLNTVKTTVPYAAMQSVALFRDRLIVLYGTGITAKPNAYIIYSTKGEILCEYVINQFADIEPEGVFFDRETHDLFISYVDKKLYKVSL